MKVWYFPSQASAFTTCVSLVTTARKNFPRKYNFIFVINLKTVGLFVSQKVNLTMNKKREYIQSLGLRVKYN